MKNFLREGLAKKVILFAFIIGLVSPSAMAYRDGGYPAGTSPVDEGTRPSSEASLVAAVAPSVQNLNVSTSTGSASVSFSLNTNANTTVWIKDTTDSIVKTLVFDNYLSPGVTHSYTWNGTDNNGQTVSSGAYKAQVVAYNTVSSDIENYSFSYSAGQSQVAPVVTLSTYPTSFDPSEGESTTVSYTLNTSASLRVEVKYNGSIIKTLRSQSEQGAGSYNLVWDGRNTNGTVMGPNTYTIEVYATNNAGNTTKTANVVITDDPVQNAPVVTVSANPTSFDPTDGESTTLTYTLNTDADLRVDIKDGGSVIRTLRSLSDQNAGTYSNLVWNGKDSNGNTMGLGTYTAEVYAVNASGSDTETTSITIVDNGSGVTAPNLKNVYATPTPFDPDEENTRIYFTLDKTADVTVEILDGSSIIRTLVSNNSLSSGTYYYEWNGRNSSGYVVGDDTYSARVNATNSAGSDTESTSVEVDTDGGSSTCDIITSHYANPSTFDPEEEDTEITYRLSRSADVTIKITEYSGGDRVRTLFTDQYRSSGEHDVYWNGRDSYGDYVDDRSYSYEITAEVSGCSDDIEDGRITVDRDGNDDDDWPSTDEDLIRNLRVRNEIFDPRYGERAEVEFELTDRADLVVQVMDGNRVIKTLRDSDDQASGDYSYYWDGRDSDGDRVSDDLYQFRVMADNGDDTDTDRAYVEVDTDGHIIGFPENDRCAGFRDVSIYSPFCKAITLMSERGIFEGYSDGTFRPYASINRAETVKVVTLALGYDVNTGGTYRNGYRDTSDTAWYAPYLYEAKREGIATGYPDGTFRPANTINRVELLRVFLEGNQTSLYNCSPQPFDDTPITSDTNWYMKYACYAQDHGLMNSEYSSNLYPAEAMTRGDVADLFYDFEVKGLYSSYVLSRTGRSSNFGERVCVDYDRYGDCIDWEYADNGYYDYDYYNYDNDYGDTRYCVEYDRYGDCERYAYNDDYYNDNYYDNDDGYYIYRDGRYVWVSY